MHCPVSNRDVQYGRGNDLHTVSPRNVWKSDRADILRLQWRLPINQCGYERKLAE